MPTPPGPIPTSSWLWSIESCDREWPGHVQLAYHVVYCIPALEHVGIAEIVTTKLAHPYTQDGGGSNCFPAGLSTMSAEDLTAAEWDNNLAWGDEYALRAESLQEAEKKAERALAPQVKRIQDLETKCLILATVAALEHKASPGIPKELASRIAESEKEFDEFMSA